MKKMKFKTKQIKAHFHVVAHGFENYTFNKLLFDKNNERRTNALIEI